MSMINVARISEMDYESHPRLGWVYWYKVGKIDQPFDQAKAILLANGFDPSLLPITTEKKAFLLAMDQIRKPSRLARSVYDNNTSTRFQITDEQLEGDRLVYNNKRHVEFWRLKSELKFINFSDDAGLQQEIVDAFLRYRDRVYPWSLASFAIDDGKRSNSVAVREQGGVWFTPDQYTPWVKAMENVFKMFSHGSEFYRVAILDTNRMRKSVETFIMDDVAQQIKELDNELASFCDTYKQKEVEARSLQTRLDRYDESKKKLSTYENLLGFVGSKIRQHIQEKEDEIARMMRGESDTLKVVDKKVHAKRRKSLMLGMDVPF